jgi:hypothetical protein
MLGDGTSLKVRYGVGAAAALGLMLLPGPWLQEVHAGPLSQLKAQASVAKVRAAAHVDTAHVELCVGVARSPSCREAFETALRQTRAPLGARGTLFESLAGNRAPLAIEDSERQRLFALKFNEDPEWKRRAKVLARDGIPFVRIPQGMNHQVLVGITPHGQFGVSLKDTTGE